MPAYADVMRDVRIRVQLPLTSCIANILPSILNRLIHRPLVYLAPCRLDLVS